MEYLFLRREPVCEFDWNPLQGRLRPDDTIRTATRRSLRVLGAMPEPEPWIELQSKDYFHVGDVDLIHWPVGYGVSTDWKPRNVRREAVADLRWEALSGAFQLLQEEDARRSLFRIHMEALSS